MNLLLVRKRNIEKVKRKKEKKEKKMKNKISKFLIKMAKKGAKECTFSDCDWYWNNVLSHDDGEKLLKELNERFKGQIIFKSPYTTFTGRVKILEDNNNGEKIG